MEEKRKRPVEKYQLKKRGIYQMNKENSTGREGKYFRPMEER